MSRLATLLAAVVVLFSSTACLPEEEAEDDPRVWAVDLIPDDGSTSEKQATWAGEDHQVTLRFVVYATTCAPEAYEHALDRGNGYGHTACLVNPSPEIATSLNRDYPEMKISELTITAHAQIVIELGDQRVESIDGGRVGPLRMGEPVLLDAVSWKFDPSIKPHITDGTGNVPYRIYGMLSDCRLSNGSACGANSRRIAFSPPGEGVGSTGRGLGAAGAELTIPDRAAGLTKLALGSGQEGNWPSPPQNRPIGTIPVRRTAFGLYQAGRGLGRVYFWGAELAQPPPVDQTIVEQALGMGVIAGGLLVPNSSQLRQYDAGPLGGQVWCQTYRHKVLAQTLYGCGWVDQSTVGTISVNDYALTELGLTEAEAAALLVRMRADIETVR
ncbi:MAG TPA: hypothetical protein VFC00_22585 [Micromonosporaceae bacterium]|nr:hypothetical protein [Micromonosporaceae bacterium]